MSGLMRIWRATILVSPADWRLRMHVDINAHVHGRPGFGFAQIPIPPRRRSRMCPQWPAIWMAAQRPSGFCVAFAELLGAAWALFYYNPRPRDVKRADQGPGRRILLGWGGRRPRPGLSRPWPQCPRFPAPLPPRNFPDSYNSSTNMK